MIDIFKIYVNRKYRLVMWITRSTVEVYLIIDTGIQHCFYFWWISVLTSNYVNHFGVTTCLHHKIK